MRMLRHMQVPTHDGLGKRVRELRLERNLSIQRLAVAAGLSYATVSHIELYGRAPRFDTLRKLAAGLDVDPSELFTQAA